MVHGGAYQLNQPAAGHGSQPHPMTLDDSLAPHETRGYRRRNGEARCRLRPPSTRGNVVATVELNRGFVLTAELVLRYERTDVRLQLNVRKPDGALRPLALRATFASSYLAQVIAALAEVQRVLSSAVPIAPDPALAQTPPTRSHPMRKLYRNDEGLEIDDEQIDREARVLMRLDEELRELAKTDEMAAYKQALAITMKGFRSLEQISRDDQAFGRPMNREAVNDVELDRRVRELVRTDDQLKTLHRSDPNAAYREGLSRVNRTVRLAR